jgi:iron complex outermembrane receptor protein
MKYSKRNLLQRVSYIAVAGAAIGTTAIQSAAAQQDQENDNQDEVLFIEELVITAQRRSENLQEVPVAVTGLSAQRVEDTGFDEVADLSLLVPSFSFGSFGPVAFSALRGVGFENTTAGGDPSVTFHVDDVYIGRPVGAVFSAFDTERVEVLRGPQGTLYGRNATGGSINLITKKPDEEFGGEIDAQYGNFESFRFRGALNIPVSETLQTRIVGFVQGNEGFTDNAFPGGTRGNENDTYGIRGHIAYRPQDNIDVLLSANYIDTGGSGAQPELREPFPQELGLSFITPAGQPGPLVGIPAFGDLVNDQDPFSENVNTPQTSDNTLLLLSAKVEIEFGDFSFKSITGYVETSFNSVVDQDLSAADIGVLRVVEEGEQFTQEFQISSNFVGPFNFIAGFFYFNEEAFRDSQITGGAFDPVAQQFGLPFGTRFLGDVEAESIAGFIHGTYDISPELKLTAGFRVTNDTKEGTNNIITTAFGGPPFALTPFNSISTTEPSWRISLDYQATDDVLLYASYARGYKSGGINGASPASNVQGITPPTGPVNQGVPVVDPNAPNGVFDPEFIDTYEIGLKSQLFDNRLQLNLAAFYSDYRDLQFQVFSPFPSADNAGNARIFGLEADFQAVVSEQIHIDGSLGFLDTEYTEFLFTTPGGVLDFEGNELNRAPDFAANFGINYFLPVPEDWGQFYFRGDFSYKGSQFFRPNNIVPDDQTDSFTNTNLRLFWIDPDDQVTVEFFVTNLFDTTQEVNILRGLGPFDTPNGGGQEFIAFNPPRQYGARVAYRF